MRFTKMHGAGNDYVYVNCFRPAGAGSLAATGSPDLDRHFGVGGDGLILIRPSQRGRRPDADVQRRRLGSGDVRQRHPLRRQVRLRPRHLRAGNRCRIETGAGVLALRSGNCQTAGSTACASTWASRSWQRRASRPRCRATRVRRDVALPVGGRTLQVTCVSMGNPHCVDFRRRATDELVLGSARRSRPTRTFPRGSTSSSSRCSRPREVRQRTWERGSGETWACGTGASAVCVAGVLAGRTERRIVNHLLRRRSGTGVDEADNHVYMTGPATEVFSGEWSE